MTAHLLREQGADVHTFTLRLTASAAADTHVARARAVAGRLGIPHHVLELADAFESAVIRPFVEAYRHGQTPSPCVVCNRRIKFGALLDHVTDLGCTRLATGHYARVETDAGGRVQLHRGVDCAKDQSYFLHCLSQAQLRRTVFPVGGMRKPKVREHAHELGLVPEDQDESQDLCFILGGDYAAFVAERCPDVCRPGPIAAVDGTVLGRHDGTYRFTVGQRRGLGLSGGPWYVVKVLPRIDTVVVGRHADQLESKVRLRAVNWIAAVPATGAEEAVLVQLRYNMRPVAARVSVTGPGTAVVQLEQPAAAITPGQAAVFYSGDQVLGGGWIQDTAVDSDPAADA